MANFLQPPLDRKRIIPYGLRSTMERA